jgi:hypothetical protein
MSPRRQDKTPAGRVHVVMVPGFAGFDALGQLQYYAAVTRVFRAWAATARRDVVLHYFDNFPTAAVVTRAARLQTYLAKRLVRGEFQPTDHVALVGHSTGGLDIRRVLRNLAECPHETMPLDGGEGTACDVAGGDVLGLVHRVVFLSVPHWGTNIADWVRAHDLARLAVIAKLRLAVTASQLPLADAPRDWMTLYAASLAGADLLHAMRDALREIDPDVGTAGPGRTAAAHEAAAELELWLRYMTWDFGAIDDLVSARPEDVTGSPAHFSAAERDAEIARWANHEIRTRSYATLGRCPFTYAGDEVPAWELLRPGTYPPCCGVTGADLVYRTCYRACAGGPFDRTVPASAPTYLSPSHAQTISSWGHQGRIERWHNDGIVNTASMFWPEPEATRLVPGDHMDIVGHYTLVPAIRGHGRSYQAYDLMRSESGFDAAVFEQVWRDVFTFCAG